MAKLNVLFAFLQITLFLHGSHAGFTEGAPCSSRNTFLLSARTAQIPKTIHCVDIKTRRSINKYLGLFKNASTLYADNMNLKKIPVGIVMSMPKLEVADFSKNKLTNINPTIFTKHQKLDKLFLTENYVKIPKETPLISSKSLVTLQLASNGIRKLYPKTFAFLPKLQVLYLGENFINVVDPAVFRPLEQLKFLDLSNNNLMTQPGRAVRLSLPRTLLEEYFLLDGNPFNSEYENEVYEELELLD